MWYDGNYRLSEDDLDYIANDKGCIWVSIIVRSENGESTTTMQAANSIAEVCTIGNDIADAFANAHPDDRYYIFAHIELLDGFTVEQEGNTFFPQFGVDGIPVNGESYRESWKRRTAAIRKESRYLRSRLQDNEFELTRLEHEGYIHGI